MDGNTALTEKEKTVKEETKWTIIRKKIAAPLLLFVVFLGAATAMKSLQTVKEVYDKEQKAPLLIVEKLPGNLGSNSGNTNSNNSNNPANSNANTAANTGLNSSYLNYVKATDVNTLTNWIDAGEKSSEVPATGKSAPDNPSGDTNLVLANTETNSNNQTAANSQTAVKAQIQKTEVAAVNSQDSVKKSVDEKGKSLRNADTSMNPSPLAAKNETGEKQTVNDKKSEEKNIIKRSISDIRYRKFKDADDLLGAIYEFLAATKTYELKNLQNELLIANKSISENGRDQKTALRQFEDWKEDKRILNNGKNKDEINNSVDNKSLEETITLKEVCPDIEKVKVDKKETQIESFSLMCTALASFYNELGTKERAQSIPKAKIEEKISKYFKENVNNVERKNLIETEINDIDKKYDPIYEKTYTALKGSGKLPFILYINGEKSPPSKNENTNANGSISGNIDKVPDSSGSREGIFDNTIGWTKETFLADSSGLNVIYKLLMVTSIVIIVFTVLYLILIPLKHIFFLAASGDVLARQAERLLERKETAAAAASAGMGRTIVGALATVGIGAAVIAGNPNVGNILYGGAESSNVERQNISNNPQTTINPTSKIFNTSDNGEFTKVLNELRTSIDVLENSVKTNLSKPNITYAGNGVDPSVVLSALGNVSTAVGNVRNLIGEPANSDTVIGSISDVRGGLSNISNISNRMSREIGNLSNTSRTISNQAANISNMSAATNAGIYTLNGTANRIENTANRINAITNRIDVKADSISSTANTINSMTGNIQTIAANTSATAKDVQRNVLGRDGKNILTSFKTLFSRERQKVTEGSIQAIMKAVTVDSVEEARAFEKIIRGLDCLAKAEKVMPQKNFKAEVLDGAERPSNIKRKVWDQWWKIIMSYTRVARY